PNGEVAQHLWDGQKILWVQSHSNNRSADPVFSPHSLRYDFQLEILRAALADAHASAAILVQANKVWILPGISRNIFPGINAVIPGSDTVEVKTAGCIRDARVIKIRPLTSRGLGD